MIHNGPFGSCCGDLEDAMKTPPNSMFRVEENGVLYFTFGYVATEQGPGWFDQGGPILSVLWQTVTEQRRHSAEVSGELNTNHLTDR